MGCYGFQLLLAPICAVVDLKTMSAELLTEDAVLCCVCCAVLCCAVLCCAVLCCAVLGRLQLQVQVHQALARLHDPSLFEVRVGMHLQHRLQYKRDMAEHLAEPDLWVPASYNGIGS